MPVIKSIAAAIKPLFRSVYSLLLKGSHSSSPEEMDGVWGLVLLATVLGSKLPIAEVVSTLSSGWVWPVSSPSLVGSLEVSWSSEVVGLRAVLKLEASGSSDGVEWFFSTMSK